MNFFAWHYTEGISLYLKRWDYVLRWVVHFFSLPLLIKSLFSPYHRLLDDQSWTGFNPSAWFRRLTFNLISRGIGAFIRLWLLVFGLFLLLPVTLVGFIGLIFWLIFPFIGLAYYLTQDPHSEKLLKEISSTPERLYETTPGKFFLSHLNLSPSDLSIPASKKVSFTTPPETFVEIIHTLIENEVWPRVVLQKLNTDFSDLLTAAHWWDLNNGLGLPEEEPHTFGRPGIGLNLLFGYTPTLNAYTSDMSQTNFTHHLIGRKELVSRLERSLSTNRSVILSGLAGVGKKTVVYEFAYKCRTGRLGPKMSYKRVVEFDYTFLLSKSMDINQKKAEMNLILSECVNAGNIILVVKDLHRLIHPEVEGLDFTDIFEKFFEQGLLLITLETSSDYERFMANNNRLKKHMDLVEVEPPTKDQALEILIEFSSTLETSRKITITTQSLRTVILGTDKYITDTPYPEKALELLDHSVAAAEKNVSVIITPDIVNSVLAERTGISMARLTESEKTKLADLESLLHKRLIGQDQAVTLIAKSLRARAVGTKSESRPLGSFLFLGPTGVGKTETAKTLAEVYYGNEVDIIRYDMAEFAGQEGIIRLIGSVGRNEPGVLTTAIKNHPASLLLLDEIEKAPSEVFNLFLSLLDEGVITDAFGNKIICRHLFVIATSNAGSEFIRQAVSRGETGEQLSSSVIDYIQKQGIFSPEFLNRFDGIVVYEPLIPDQLNQIARLMFGPTIKNLSIQGIDLTVADSAVTKLAQIGFKPEFGARPMRRIVDIEVGDLLGKAILKNEIEPGDKIELTAGESTPFAFRKI